MHDLKGKKKAHFLEIFSIKFIIEKLFGGTK